MARSNALGSWLNESKRKDTRRQQVALSNMDRHKLSRELRWWTARGALWIATLFVAVSADVAGASSARFFFSARLDFLVVIPRCNGSSDVTTRMGLTCSITPHSDPPLHTLDRMVAHLCTFSESRAPGPESTHAWQRTIHRKSISFRWRRLITHLLIPHRPIDITGRSVGGENTLGKFDCAALVSSFLGLLVLALPSCFCRQSHLLCLCTVLRSIREQIPPSFSLILISDVTPTRYSFTPSSPFAFIGRQPCA